MLKRLLAELGAAGLADRTKPKLVVSLVSTDVVGDRRGVSGVAKTPGNTGGLR